MAGSLQTAKIFNTLFVICGLVCGPLAAVADGSHMDTSSDLSQFAPKAKASDSVDDAKNIDAAKDVSPTTRVDELEATRAALDRRNGSNVSLSVSGWVGTQVQKTSR